MSVKIEQIKASETIPIRHQVMWPDQPVDFVKLPEDALGEHYGLFLEEELVSIISLFVRADEAQFRKFATLTKLQGKGYGTMLLKKIIDIVKAKQLKKLWCNARVDKLTYYKKFGFTQTTKKYTKAGIEFVVIEKVL